jgi:hypothetical protein
MAYTDQQVRDYLQQNLQGASDAQIAAEMARFGVDTSQMARATNIPVEDIQGRFIEAVTPRPASSADATTNVNRFTDADVRQYLLDRPGYSDAEITADMIRFGVGPEQVARATQLPLTDVQSRFDAVINPLLATLPGGAVTPTRPVTPTPVVPGPAITPLSPTLTPPNVPETLLPGNVGGNVVGTPPISRDFPTIATEGGPTTATQYIQPSAVQVGGALIPEYTEIPEGVTPLAVPALNVRNLINQGVVPRYVAAPRSSGNLIFEPIQTIGDRIF